MREWKTRRRGRERTKEELGQKRMKKRRESRFGLDVKAPGLKEAVSFRACVER